MSYYYYYFILYYFTLCIIISFHAIVFKECIAVIRDKTGTHSEADRLKAFDELEMIVEGIDNASNMEKMKLWPEIFACLSSDESVAVIKFALWIIGTCAQNNPETQTALLQKHDIFFRLLSLWQAPIYNVETISAEIDEITDCSTGNPIHPKIMYCLSSLLSNHPAGLENFVTHAGFKIIDSFHVSLRDKMSFLLCSVLSNEIGADALRCLLNQCTNLLDVLDNPSSY